VQWIAELAERTLESAHDRARIDTRLVRVKPSEALEHRPSLFRPEDPRDLSRLRFICFNENRFYSSDMPDGAKLYEGTAVRATLPRADVAIATQERINPLFFQEAPEAWRNTRPDSQDEFVHFHSCYNGAGPVHTGYWIRHVAVSDFTYDMGGRVGKKSPLYHRVQIGPDRDFARIIEFDRGPEKGN
jgi:hypothetical protein